MVNLKKNQWIASGANRRYTRTSLTDFNQTLVNQSLRSQGAFTFIDLQLNFYMWMSEAAKQYLLKNFDINPIKTVKVIEIFFWYVDETKLESR